MKTLLSSAASLLLVGLLANLAQAQAYQNPVTAPAYQNPVAGSVFAGSVNCAEPVGSQIISGCSSCGNPNCSGCTPVAGCTTCDSCSLEIKEEKVKKTCFEVEKKTICIPTVQLPFGFCCKPLGARSKTIKVLKTKSYEVLETKYIWTAQEPACPPCESVVPCADAVASPMVAPVPVAPQPTPSPEKLQTPPEPAAQPSAG